MRILVLLAALSACRLTGTFECGLDEACRRGNDFGVCEVDGYCSFGDPDCDSGRRYADNAGDSVAGTCVDPGTAQPLSCLDKWRTNTVRFGAVTDLGVNSAMDDRDPWLNVTGSLLLFSSNRTTSMDFDIWTATRGDITVPFAAPTRVAAYSSAGADSRASLSTDQLTIYLTSNRTDTRGGNDVWRATRLSPTGTFSAFDEATLESVNTNEDETDAIVSQDGLRLYLAIGDVDTNQHLATSTRGATSEAFSEPASIVELESGESDADPAPSRDALLMIFTSFRTNAIAGSNLWYSTRATTTEKWLPARLVPDINIDGDEGDPHLSDDGCTLVFSRSLPAAPRDLVFAPVMQ